MIDNSLHLEGYFPVAGANVTVGALDLGVDQPGFSNQWRQVRARVAWPALPNHTNTAITVTLTLQDSADGGSTYQSGGSGTALLLPLIQVQIPGVATNGAAAGTVDVSLPPGLRGPISFIAASPANTGDNTAALFTIDIVNE